MELQDVQNRYAHHVPRLLNGRGEFAVLVPLVERPEGLCLLYEVRAEGIRQPREVCFPGGKMETGEDAVACAVRETWEELGIPAEAIEVIAPLDYLHLRNDTTMYPILARVDETAVNALHPSEAEVADTFLVPVKWLQEHPPTLYRYPMRPMIGEDFPFEAVQIPRDYPWGDGRMEVPVYEGLPYPLWGLTARITYYLLKSME
ncbi:MAG: CoA pyrophosphatase [Oscillospiraceae bacterium]|nr:CoA pyrophosphatase [Oscillospiraceae bacterium]